MTPNRIRVMTQYIAKDFNGPEALDVTGSGNQFLFDMAAAGATVTKMGPGNDDDTVLDRPPEVKSFSKPQAKQPKMYQVMLHNDDTTPFDFVVHVLRKHFNVPQSRATALMLAAHTQGMAVVCLYSKEIAEAKVDAANIYCRSQSNPVTNAPTELTFSAVPEM